MLNAVSVIAYVVELAVFEVELLFHPLVLLAHGVNHHIGLAVLVTSHNMARQEFVLQGDGGEEQQKQQGVLNHWLGVVLKPFYVVLR